MRVLTRAGLRRLALLALLAAAGACEEGTSPGAFAVQVGVLADTTGPGATLGARALRAARAAAEDFNGRGAQARVVGRVELLVENTQFQPTRAASAVRAMRGRGVRIVVGPQSSAEVAAAKPVADAEGVLVVSYGSTARSLSLAGDNVLRLVPDDTREGRAHAALMWSEGARTVVPLWRADPGNDGLHQSLREAFEARGGRVTAGVRYDPATTDFAPALAQIRAQVAASTPGAGPGGVVVYLAGFDEAAVVLAQAAGDAVLAGVRWHGGDGTNQSAAVLASPAAAAFAAAVQFRAATYGLDDALLAGRAAVVARVMEPGAPADPFALAAYDAVMLAARAHAAIAGDGEEGGGLARGPDALDLGALRAALLGEAGTYAGATGATTLNEAGDRAAGDFDFYRVCQTAGGHAWRRTSTYRDADGTVAARGGC